MSTPTPTAGLDLDSAALELVVGELDIPCEHPNHAEVGSGRVEHLARTVMHDGCRNPLLSVCEGCLALLRSSNATLRRHHLPVRCVTDNVVACCHGAVLEVHPIRCAP